MQPHNVQYSMVIHTQQNLMGLTITNKLSTAYIFVFAKIKRVPIQCVYKQFVIPSVYPYCTVRVLVCVCPSYT